MTGRAPLRWAIGSWVLLVAGGVGWAAEAPPRAAPVTFERPANPSESAASRLQALALRDEISKDWHRALARWEAIGLLDPKNTQWKRRVGAIRRDLAKGAERHLAIAKRALRRKQTGQAFREFLRTLSYDPDNALALSMVKYELNAKSIVEYAVKRGDTLREIAVEQYKDPDLTYLLIYYNDVANPRDLKIGQVLKMPLMVGVELGKPKPKVAEEPAAKPAPRAPASQAAASEQPEKSPPPAAGRPAAEADAGTPSGEADRDADGIVDREVRAVPPPAEYQSSGSDAAISNSKQLLKAGNYEQAATVAEAALEADPINADAQELVNAAYYARGRQLRDQAEYVGALQALSKVDPGYRDVGTMLSSVRGELSGQQAELHYIAGVTAFLGEDLDTAIMEWEFTLKLDPSHPQAARDLENAKALRAKLSNVR